MGNLTRITGVRFPNPLVGELGNLTRITDNGTLFTIELGSMTRITDNGAGTEELGTVSIPLKPKNSWFDMNSWEGAVNKSTVYL